MWRNWNRPRLVKSGLVSLGLAFVLNAWDWWSRTSMLDPYFGVNKDTFIGHVLVAAFSVPSFVFIAIAFVFALLWCYAPEQRDGLPPKGTVSVAATPPPLVAVPVAQKKGPTAPLAPVLPSPKELSDARWSNALTEAQRKYSERAIITLRPSSLYNIYRQHMADEADSLIRRYIGNWLVILGTLDDRKSVDSAILVSVAGAVSEHGDILPLVFLTFDMAWDGRLKVIEKGSEVLMMGKLRHVSGIGITVSDSELM